MQPLVEAVALVGPEQLVMDELLPEDLVATHELGRRLLGLGLERAPELRRDVGELPGEVLLRDLEVVPALAVGERRVELSGLGVHEVRREGPGVAPEEHVRERDVAPEEAGEVQPHEQLGARVEQPVAEIRQSRAGEQRPVGERVVEMPCDQHRLEALRV